MSAKLQRLVYLSHYEYYPYCAECGWRGKDQLNKDYAENEAVTHDGNNHPEVF